MKKNIVTSGKRKASIAKATLKPGTGKVTFNGTLLNNVTPEIAKMKIMEPLMLADDAAKKVDITISATGGGVIGMADAAKLAVGKAMLEFTGSKQLKETYLNYDRSIVVADVRRKESRKPNTHGNARAKTQKSYR